MPYGDYMVYMKGKNAVYTTSLPISRELEQAGYTRMFFVNGAISSARPDCQLITGSTWLNRQKRKRGR